MLEQLVCRDAEPGDLEALLALYSELSGNNPMLDPGLAGARFAQMCAMPGLRVGIGQKAGRIVTTATLLLVPNLTRGARPFGVIENVVTAHSDRGRGYARGLLVHLVSLARQADAYKVMLMTGRNEESVFRFYESCGFRRGTKTAFEIRF